jgi:NAD(P)-dependent dehydrogenase (short-subunit alcohol dehydrogenase family)
MGFECGRRLLAIADHVLLVDRDEASVLDAARELSAETGNGVTVEPFVLDVTDREGLHRLAERTADIGVLRAVTHAKDPDTRSRCRDGFAVRRRRR